jgi:hypothetical protein
MSFPHTDSHAIKILDHHPQKRLNMHTNKMKQPIQQSKLRIGEDFGSKQRTKSIIITLAHWKRSVRKKRITGFKAGSFRSNNMRICKSVPRFVRFTKFETGPAII